MDGFYYHGELEFITEIVKNRLYFAVLEGTESIELQNSLDTCYFCTDKEYVYLNFYHDFGPLNIACLYRYCCKVNQFLNSSVRGIQRYVHYTTKDPKKRANAGYLIGCYAVLFLNMDPKEVYQRLYNAGGVFKNFVDASQGPSPYTITILDCFKAIKKCQALNFFNFSDFNVQEYENIDKLVNGDMNWLVPRKFLAFIGPSDTGVPSADAFSGHHPSFYINYFLNNDIKMVIRLNSKVYNEAVFKQAGIEHINLFFPDGTIPPKHILLKFLNISERTSTAIAVHCKAGLGRTGSLIGAYIVKHYHLTAREAIAWMRICRPGSVIGPQQDWLEKIEKWLWKQGSQYRTRHFGDGDKIPHHKFGIYSISWQTEKAKIYREMHKQVEVDVKKRDGNVGRKSVADVQQVSLNGPTLTRQDEEFDKKQQLLIQKEEELRRLSALLYNIQSKQKMRMNLEKDKGVLQSPVFSRVLDNRLNDLKRSKTATVKRTTTDNVIGKMEQLKRKVTTAVVKTPLRRDPYVYDHIALSPLNNVTRPRIESNVFRRHESQGDKLNEIKMKRFSGKVFQERIQKMMPEKQVAPYNPETLGMSKMNLNTPKSFSVLNQKRETKIF